MAPMLFMYRWIPTCKILYFLLYLVHMINNFFFPIISGSNFLLSAELYGQHVVFPPKKFLDAEDPEVNFSVASVWKAHQKTRNRPLNSQVKTCAFQNAPERFETHATKKLASGPRPFNLWFSSVEQYSIGTWLAPRVFSGLGRRGAAAFGLEWKWGQNCRVESRKIMSR